jgi:hypothetical protein
MRTARLLAPLALFVTAAACGSVPNDPGARIFAPGGIIRGTVLYQGPRPCSSNGHIVGNAILLVFDRRNPPPPNGLAVTAVNFADVTGDRLFANEPRYTGTDIYCPLAHGFTETINVSATFAIGPLGTQNPDGSVTGGSYMIESFFDYTGDFLPTFSTRRLPEKGDIGGGDIDTADALKTINNGNPNYQPHFLEVDVGIPRALQAGQTIPDYDIPSAGFVADNVSVAIGQSLPLTRPYFYAQGIPATYQAGSTPNTSTVAQPVGQDSSCAGGAAAPCPQGNSGIAHTAETSPDYLPILTIPQDLAVLSPPSATDADGANQFDAGFPHINLKFGVPQSEIPCASGGACAQSAAPGQSNPFHFQLQTPAGTPESISVWQNAYFDETAQQWTPLHIPEGGGLPMLWPLVILNKLVDDQEDPTQPGSGIPDPFHGNDPASLTAQGDATHPVVIMQGITLLNAQQPNPLTGQPAESDTFLNTVLAAGVLGLPSHIFSAGQPTQFQQDHLMVALRPSVICFNHLFDNPLPPDTRGVLVSPYSSNTVASGTGGTAVGPIVPPDLLKIDQTASDHRFPVTTLVNSVKYGCLPKGRYAINIVYPDGQAWSVPNEAGACSGTEGLSDFGNLTCTIKPRPILYSQGNRAVVEVVGPTNPQSCQSPSSSPQDGSPHGPPGDPAPATGPAFVVPSECLPTQ